MLNFLPLLIGKVALVAGQTLHLGSGSTWPGHVALKINPDFCKEVLKNSESKIVLIAGTNGKTTTGRLISQILSENKKSLVHNPAGANLLNGLSSALVRASNLFGKIETDYLIFECDENALPIILKQMSPDYIICLDLFRDQLDRYGEIDSIAKKWKESFSALSEKTTLLLNADDPQIAYLSKDSKAKAIYFGLDEKGKDETTHGADTTHCLNCGNKLNFNKAYFSHLGVWNCTKCDLKRPEPNLTKLETYPLLGTYNKYNALAAALFAKSEGTDDEVINKTYKNFTPAFGRQEKIIYKGKNVQIFLSKNPTSFNESLSTVIEAGANNLLLVLNDRIPDGLDVSWIWDINFEDIISNETNITVSGDRVYDMALRLKYAQLFTHVESDLRNSIDKMIENLSKEETLYILPNYSAMLEVRKILTGRKIL